MSLRQSSVNRSLDNQFKVMGFEAADLLALLLIIGFLKVGFTGSGLETYLVWIPSGVLAVVLRVAKTRKAQWIFEASFEIPLWPEEIQCIQVVKKMGASVLGIKIN